MKGKLAALGTLVIAFAIFEYLFYPHSTLPRDPKALAARLLPPAIGSFRSTERWTSNRRGQRLEVYSSYRDGRAVEVDVDVWLDAGAPHNGVRCWYVRGDPTLWQRLSKIRMAKTSAIFDTALFHEEHGLVLLAANTECYPRGCYESLVGEGVDALGLRLAVFSEPAVATPISILVRELNDPTTESPQTQGGRLMQDFERFTAQLDLNPLLARAVAREVGGTERGGRNSP